MQQSEKSTSYSDGRLQRSERSRQAIAQALIELVREGEPRPTAERVATRAGVGIRTVFRHFSDMETLFKAMHESIEEEVYPLLQDSTEGSLEERVEKLITHRGVFFEHTLPFRRSADLLAEKSKFLQSQKLRMTKRLRENLLEWIPELDEPPSDLLEICDTLASAEHWDRMRHSQKLSRSRASTLIKKTILKMLSEKS